MLIGIGICIGLLIGWWFIPQPKWAIALKDKLWAKVWNWVN